MYSFLRSLLFLLPTELSHTLSLKALVLLYRSGLLGILFPPLPDNPQRVFGLEFANPVGLAAGLDKNGDYIDALGALGFGFIEIGTVTPRPQPGNSKPRLFRLPQAEAIINRMGFNNKGVDYLVERARNRQYRGVLGINIGKNVDTPVENALQDYLLCMDKVYSVADYITVNLSSPNTPGLRSLQFGESLRKLVQALQAKQQALALIHKKQVPLLVKIAPDMTDDELVEVASILGEAKIDGVIATNTTISRELVKELNHGSEAGGLSGRPLTAASTHIIKKLDEHFHHAIPIIGVGGIFDTQSAMEKLNAGASLVQVYTGFIYRGPTLIRKLAMLAFGRSS
ncbi:MAG: quinone-dependent dihydroorotate dehydrogenase [Pseudomonadales bacterium]|nr:quinone-dependent dihydroorotate dehydrogenase [Pseudomonadales bacterium]